MPLQPNYKVEEHRLDKKVKRWFTPQGCCVESKKTLFLNSLIIYEEVTMSSRVDVSGPLEDDGYFK